VREDSRIQAIEIKFLRTIMRKTKRNRIINVHVREEFRMEGIQYQIKKID
jgi:hypothetical protein